MTNSFGPWTTGLSHGAGAQLSAFWKRRLGILPSLAIAAAPRSRWPRLSVVVVVATLCLMPTLWGTAAPQETAPAPISNEVVPEPEDTVATVALADGSAPVDDDPHRKALLAAITRGVAQLRRSQRTDGSFPGTENNSFPVGVTSLSTLALLSAGVSSEDEVVQKALAWLRKQDPGMTYEVSLQTLAFCAAEPKQDLKLIQRNAIKLEQGQIRNGENAGSWSYGVGQGGGLNLGGDRSNGKFAIWALDEAVGAGAEIPAAVWERAYHHWRDSQNHDGSWGYTGQAGGGGSGSMTCSGMVSFSICSRRVAEINKAKPKPEDAEVIARAAVWLGRNFSVLHNPGGNHWLMYYFMTLRQTGEITGEKKFGDHDWYREGAQFLIEQQSQQTGAWKGIGSMERDPVVGTAMALLFLRNGAP